MISIIVPIRYRADLTRVCIDSILNYTNISYELILVQEGEDEEITNLIKSYKVKFTQNKESKGFAAATPIWIWFTQHAGGGAVGRKTGGEISADDAAAGHAPQRSIANHRHESLREGF